MQNGKYKSSDYDFKKKKDSNSIRKSSLVASLECCDSDKVRIDFLIDMVLQLQNNLVKLQMDYVELISYVKNLDSSCARLPF